MSIGDPGHLVSRKVDVDGRPATYSVGGHGLPVLFLHGWGLAEHSYKRALKRLVVQGCRVYAPALPGFSGTADLPAAQRTLRGYGKWVSDFMDAVDIRTPALVVGHSFGGGVGIRLAHDYPARVRFLVLLNSVGAPAPRRGLAAALNPTAWWPLGALRDSLPLGEGARAMRAAAEDFLPNLLRHPRTLLEVGLLARRADLSVELVQLAKRDLPVLVLWGDHDRVLPTGAFEALCGAIGSEGRVVSGSHSWLLADPDAFGQVMSNVVEVASCPNCTEFTQLLGGTSMTEDVMASMLDAAAPLWLMSEPTPTLAGDLALCHPPLAPGEIRAVARECELADCFRLTIVAHDRPGLLADTTAVLAAEQLSVIRASATTWLGQGLALHSLVVEAPEEFPVESWEALAARLRTLSQNKAIEFLFSPGGRAVVRSTPQAMGRSLLSVTAPDQIGLLWAICDWLARNDVTIEAMRVENVGLIARDEFVVRGSFDPHALQTRLSLDSPTLTAVPLQLVSAAFAAVRKLTAAGRTDEPKAVVRLASRRDPTRGTSSAGSP